MVVDGWMVKTLWLEMHVCLAGAFSSVCAEDCNLPSQITAKGLLQDPEGNLVPMTEDKLSHNVALRTRAT